MSEWRRTTNGRREVSYDNTTWWPEEHDTAILAYQAERKEQADALSVLRDLVALPSFVTAASMSDGPLNALYVRASALVAEHPTNEETT